MEFENMRGLMNEYLKMDYEDERRAYLIQQFGHPPSLHQWETLETARTGIRAVETGMTSGDIAKLTGLSPARIRRMSERGEMPAPVYRGEVIKWRWWDRAEIETWWEGRQHANGGTAHS